MRRRATPDTVSFANIYECPYSPLVPVHGNGHTALAITPPTGVRGSPAPVAPLSPPLVTGGCPFFFQFIADFIKKGEIIGGGLANDDGQFVKGGFAALTVRPSWAVTDVTHWGDVHLIGTVNSSKDKVPGGNPNTNYYKLTAKSSGRVTVEGATQPKDISLDALDWCLPLSAIVEEEVAERIARHLVEKEGPARFRPPSILGPHGPSAGTGPSPDAGKTAGSPGQGSNQLLPCYAGRARGKANITFYIPFPPTPVSSLGVTPPFSFDIGATGTYKGRELTWLQQKILVYGTSNLPPAPHDPRHLPRPPGGP